MWSLLELISKLVFQLQLCSYQLCILLKSLLLCFSISLKNQIEFYFSCRSKILFFHNFFILVNFNFLFYSWFLLFLTFISFVFFFATLFQLRSINRIWLTFLLISWFEKLLFLIIILRWFQRGSYKWLFSNLRYLIFSVNFSTTFTFKRRFDFFQIIFLFCL